MNEQEVSFESGGSTLGGTYAEADQPVAAALLIPGSGRVGRAPVSPEMLGIVTAWIERTWGGS